MSNQPAMAIVRQFYQMKITPTQIMALVLLVWFGAELPRGHPAPILGVDTISWGRIMLAIGLVAVIVDGVSTAPIKTAFTLPWLSFLVLVMLNVVDASPLVKIQVVGASLMWLYLIWRGHPVLAQFSATPHMVMAAMSAAYGIATTVAPSYTAGFVWEAYGVRPIEFGVAIALCGVALLLLAPDAPPKVQAVLSLPYLFSVYASHIGVLSNQMALPAEYAVAISANAIVWYYLIFWRRAYVADQNPDQSQHL